MFNLAAATTALLAKGRAAVGLDHTGPDAVDAAQRIGTQQRDRLGQNRLIREYCSYMVSAPIVRNVAPWHARGEQLTTALLLYQLAAAPESFTVPAVHIDVPLTGGLPVPCAAIALGLRVESAVPYLWTYETFEAAAASPALPSHVVSASILPQPMMFWSFAQSYPLVDLSTDAVVGSSNWLFLYDQGPSIAVVYDVVSGTRGRPDNKIRLTGGSIAYGATYPDSFEIRTKPSSQPQPLPPVDRVLKFLAFLNSPYVTSDASSHPRHLRHRLLSTTPTEASQTVNVVYLRRPTGKTTPGETEATKRNWKHQWWVAGHYRAQWYPSEKAHRVIWIAPYPKGPTDKPMLIEKVYKVSR
jgi:hypothetical protein